MPTNNPDGRRGRTAPPDHGTRARYRYDPAPCACASCRAANAAYERARRSTVVAGIVRQYGRQLTIPGT
jgi:hypothetical protein